MLFGLKKYSIEQIINLTSNKFRQVFLEYFKHSINCYLNYDSANCNEFLCQ